MIKKRFQFKRFDVDVENINEIALYEIDNNPSDDLDESNLFYVYSTTDVNIQNIVDKFLLPKAADSETKVFYLKLKGDYYRYKAEFDLDKDFPDTCDKAEKVYKEGYEIANKDLRITNPIRIGLALNFSVFYYEIKGLKEEACNIAKTAFDESMKVLDDLEKSKAKETLLIIQLLKENLILWNNEMNEEEEN